MGTVQLSSVLALLDADQAKPVWIQIAKQGSFNGHATGKFTLGASEFAQMIANFSATQNKRVPIDFEHASEMPASHGEIPTKGAPAQGWIVDLKVRDDGNLWGLVEWGTLARDYIKSGQYRYLSPAMRFGAKDPVTGKTIGCMLSSAAMTNQPFLDGMQPLAAKRTDGAADAPPEALQVLREALKLPDEADAANCLAALEHVGIALEANGGKRLAMTSGVDLVKVLPAIRDALRLPLSTPWRDVLVAAKSTATDFGSEPPTPADATVEQEDSMDPKIIELQNENSTLTLKLTASNTELGTIKAQLTAKDAELTALKSKLEEHETKSIEELVNTTIAVHAKDMGLTEKHKSHLLRFAKADPEGFRGMYPVVPAAQQYLAKSVATGGRDDDASVVKTDPNAPPAADMSDIPTIAELVPKLMAKARDEGVELSFEQAHVKAHEKIVKLVGKSARKALAPTGT